jgi:hypothetical protein
MQQNNVIMYDALSWNWKISVVCDSAIFITS